MKTNFERHKHNTDMTQSEQAFSQHSFLVLSVVAPFWRVTIMTRQLSTATTPLCGFYSLRSRRLEVVGTRKNGRARMRHARGEEAPARKAPENRFRPLSNYLAAAAWSVKSFDRKRLTSHKQSKPPKSVVHFIFGLNISVIKMIIEWWSNKLMVNTQL